jgi:ectoine hydroxylase-related dioxygenase (phytanoyl-CoA dioxygenase family)
VLDQAALAGARTITPAQREEFEDRGYLVVENALTPGQVDAYLRLHDRIYREELEAGRLAPAGGRTNHPGAMHSFGFVLRDPAYLELLDLPTTFPLVWGILGWNVYMYHCHIDQHPPLAEPLPPAWGWHQDGGRQNIEAESEPERPRLSVKVGYFLSDVSRPGRGNFMVVPGSHRRNRIPRPEPHEGLAPPAGAVPLCVEAGAAVVFDRRLWHSRSDNLSAVTRKALFTGYTYRWIRPRDDYPIDWDTEPYRSLSPVRRQLLGWGTDAMSHWGLGSEEIPLRAWLRDRGLLDPAMPALR